MRRFRGFALLLLTVLLLSCRPDFGERESFVDRAQVLAVRIDPPEAKPGEPVTATLLVASPSGPIESPRHVSAPAWWRSAKAPAR